MKRLIFVAALALSVVSFAAEAKLTVEGENPDYGCMTGYTPFSLCIVEPVALPWGAWDLKGMQIGLLNHAQRCDGLQIGVYNGADVMRGLQIGVVNFTRKAYGVQLGVVNVISDNDIPFLPVFNCYF